MSATGARGVDTVERFGLKTGGHARSAQDKLSGSITERRRRRRENREHGD